MCRKLLNILSLKKSKINAFENEGKKPVPSNVSSDIIFDNVEFSYDSRKISVRILY